MADRLLRSCAALGLAISAHAALTILVDGRAASVGNHSITSTTTLAMSNSYAAFAFGTRKGGGFQIMQVVVDGVQVVANDSASW
jgi:hypothetical protein